MNSQRCRILLLGGYGHFGEKLSRMLINIPHTQLIISGRNLEQANAHKEKLEKERACTAGSKNKISHNLPIETLRLDRVDEQFSANLAKIQPDILVHCAGPFQQQDYTVAKACIDNNIHYVDIADARKYVSQFSILDKEAKRKKLVLITGAGTTPGLSSAVVDKYALNFSTLRMVEFSISSANKIKRGQASVDSLCLQAGKPFEHMNNGELEVAYSWQKRHREYFGDNVGVRWQSGCDAPDLELLPLRYQKLSTVKFHSGFELGLLHFLLWKLSWFVRSGIASDLSKLSKPLEKLGTLLGQFGTSVGGINIHLYGTDLEYQPLDMHWNLIAESGHDEYIPILPTYLVVKKIINQELSPGARACVSLFTLEEFDDIADQWNIYHTLSERHM